MVFDMRFIPNPFYIEELRDQTGLDAPVRDFVLSFPHTTGFIHSINRLVNELMPYYLEQDKKDLIIAIGCTGGKHRSVTVAQELYQLFCSQEHFATIEHRNIDLR